MGEENWNVNWKWSEGTEVVEFCHRVTVCDQADMVSPY